MQKPARAPDTPSILAKMPPDALAKILTSSAYQPTHDGKYLHWHRLRYLDPPGELTHEEWWAAMKLARSGSLRSIPLRDVTDRPFRYSLPDSLLRLLSELDRSLITDARDDGRLLGPTTRDRYIFSALVEEAITSSQLEGASTTRRVAKKMLREKRAPRDKSERMIFNNFQAMEFIRTRTDEPLTPQLVFDIHYHVTQGTLDAATAAGALRKSDDVRVWDLATNTVLHEPPPAAQLSDRMDQLCDFANAGQRGPWLHPILRAILLHLWLAFDHPFVDGNGRTARTLFYWSMLKAGYRLCEFISISEILKKAPTQYSMSFLHTETDENDATYFILHHLEVLKRAVDKLHDYVNQKAKSLARIQGLIRDCGEFNHRQIALLGHALKHQSHEYTVASHGTSHRVSRPTARKDLNSLADLGLLEAGRRGTAAVFRPEAKLEEKLKLLGQG